MSARRPRTRSDSRPRGTRSPGGRPRRRCRRRPWSAPTAAWPRGSGTCTAGGCIARSTMIRAGRPVARVDRDAVLVGPGQGLQPVHVVGHRQRVAGPPAVRLVDVPRRPRACRRAAPSRPCGARPGSSMYSNEPRRPAPCGPRRQQASASSAWVAMTTASKRVAGAARRPDGDDVPVRVDVDDRVARPDGVRSEQRSTMRSTYDIEPPRDRPPRSALPRADQPMVVEEPQQVVDRELAGIRSGAGRPHGRRDRRQEVVAEAAAEAARVEEVAERRLERVAASSARRASRRSAGCQRTSANEPGWRPAHGRANQPPHPARAELHAACAAGRRQRHVARLRLDAEFGEKPDERGIRRLVVDDEPGIDREWAAGGHRRPTVLT